MFGGRIFQRTSWHFNFAPILTDLFLDLHTGVTPDKSLRYIDDVLPSNNARFLVIFLIAGLSHIEFESKDRTDTIEV